MMILVFSFQTKILQVQVLNLWQWRFRALWGREGFTQQENKKRTKLQTNRRDQGGGGGGGVAVVLTQDAVTPCGWRGRRWMERQIASDGEMEDEGQDFEVR